eukprot:2869060-Alexandrium_andersonii.AAC.1
MRQPPVIRHIACERLPARQYGGGDRGDPATACDLTTGNVDSTSVTAHKAPMPFRPSAFRVSDVHCNSDGGQRSGAEG